jgi:hypothetical protein
MVTGIIDTDLVASTGLPPVLMTPRSLKMRKFRCLGADPAKMAVSAVLIIKHLDAVEHIVAG